MSKKVKQDWETVFDWKSERTQGFPGGVSSVVAASSH